MEEEKKPKRPRIGMGLSDIHTDGATGSEPRFEKVNYPGNPASSDSESGQGQQSPSSEQGYRRPRMPYSSYNRQQGDYQQRYNRQQGDYQPRQQGDYQPRQQGDYQPRQQGDYQPRYGQNRQQGDYQPRYNQNRQQGDYQPRYNQNSQQGGYQPRYNQNRQQGGYNQNRQQGGYHQPRQQGDYQPRYNQNRQGQQGGYNQNRPYNNQNRQQGQGGYNQNRGYNNNQNRQGGFNRNQGGYNNQNRQKPGMRFTPRPRQVEYVLDDIDPNEPIRLNKYMANAGLCSRREADEYIKNGKVKVNGEVVTELGTKISRSDVVEYDEKVVVPEKKCYVLLNKPKDCVTTSDDPNGRTTVLDLVKNACKERIYPVGRLDRNTTGVLLLTNDGDLASKLTHPSFVKKKIYHVWTDKDITEEHMQQIADGIELEDGEIHADAISYASETARNQAGIEIHSGRNRIVRRIFEHLGYRVTKLDRVYFAGLTKKNLPRGRWRYLTQDEVNFLRMGSFE